MSQTFRPPNGIYGISLTAFNRSDGRIDPDAQQAAFRKLFDSGAAAAVIGGNTSEFTNLTVAEQVEALEIAVHTHSGGPLLVAGVGGPVADAVAVAEHARSLGIEALMTHTPASPFATGEGLLNYHLEIADRSGLVVMPYVRTEAHDDDSLRKLASRDEVAAIKFALPNPTRFGELVTTDDTDTVWLCGLAERWAPAFHAMGAKGFTSGLVQVAPHRSIGLWDALESADRDTAMIHWAAALPFEDLRARHRDGWNVAVIKAALMLDGLDTGAVRSPASELTGDAVDLVREALDVLKGDGV